MAWWGSALPALHCRHQLLVGGRIQFRTRHTSLGRVAVGRWVPPDGLRSVGSWYRLHWHAELQASHHCAEAARMADRAGRAVLVLAAQTATPRCERAVGDAQGRAGQYTRPIRPITGRVCAWKEQQATRGPAAAARPARGLATDATTAPERPALASRIERYRSAFLWIVAVFDQSHPEAIYEITPQTLEPYFATWEARLDRQEAVHAEGGAPVHLNNPKIPLKFVAQLGLQVWPPRDTPLPQPVQLGLAMTEELDTP